MKYLCLFWGLWACLLPATGHAQLFKKIQERVKETAEQKAVDKSGEATGSAIDGAVNGAVRGAKEAVKGKPAEEAGSGSTAPQAAPAAGSGATTAPTASSPASVKAYANYDFVPGERILFEDDLQHDQDGEFPSHWELLAGQAVVNKVPDGYALLLTEGNYARVSPRMKAKAYLKGDFTVEFEYFDLPQSYKLLLIFSSEGGPERKVLFNYNSTADNFAHNATGSYPGGAPAYENRWHHAAVIRKGDQMKVYIDQYRVLALPECGCPEISRLELAGAVDPENPILLRNVRVALGGGMNMIGQKFTDAKLVTHGIRFDLDKASLRPESMGVLNSIKKLLEENPDLKFRVECHTDNSGGATRNLTLSQQRAEAVRSQLVAMGVNPARLTAKGLGDTVPLSPNTNPEGMANNRRVEFIRL